MNKEALKKHLEQAVEIMKQDLDIKRKEVEEFKPFVTIDNIGLFVRMQVEMFELEERLNQAYQDLVALND